jgi:hypothetical protein
MGHILYFMKKMMATGKGYHIIMKSSVQKNRRANDRKHLFFNVDYFECPKKVIFVLILGSVYDVEKYPQYLSYFIGLTINIKNQWRFLALIRIFLYESDLLIKIPM